jgi:hypothetical protein
MNDPLPGQNPYLASPNPYAPPAGAYVDGPAPAALAPLDAALYSPNHVALATFLGTPMAGVVLMALNEKRLGRRSAAIKTIVFGLLGTAAILTLAIALPDGIPAFPFTLVALVVLRITAQHRQGALVEQHYRAGGKKASGWAAAGISLLTTVIVFIPVVAILVLAEAAGSP